MNTAPEAPCTPVKLARRSRTCAALAARLARQDTGSGDGRKMQVWAEQSLGGGGGGVMLHSPREKICRARPTMLLSCELGRRSTCPTEAHTHHHTRTSFRRHEERQEAHGPAPNWHKGPINSHPTHFVPRRMREKHAYICCVVRRIRHSAKNRHMCIAKGIGGQRYGPAK